MNLSSFAASAASASCSFLAADLTACVIGCWNSSGAAGENLVTDATRRVGIERVFCALKEARASLKLRFLLARPRILLFSTWILEKRETLVCCLIRMRLFRELIAVIRAELGSVARAAAGATTRAKPIAVRRLESLECKLRRRE